MRIDQRSHPWGSPLIVTTPLTPSVTLSSLLIVTLALELAPPLAFVHPIVDIARVAVAVSMT